jgi:hypothetical protein
MLAVLVALPGALPASEPKEQADLMREGIQLIRLLEEVARDVRYNSGRLNSFTNTFLVSKWTHIHHLDQIKELVNDGLTPALSRLKEIQPQLPAWKQQSIEKMLEAARALAADMNAAYLAKSDAGTVPPVMNAEYKNLVTRIYEHAETLVKTSDAAGNYASARLKAYEVGLNVPKK